MTFDEIVSGVLTQGGFDVALSMAGGWVNEKHQEAVGASEWMVETISVGLIAGQSLVDIPDRVADVSGLYVVIDAADGPGDWSRVSVSEMWDLKAGRRQLTGAGGVYAPQFDEAGAKRVELYPAPVEDLSPADVDFTVVATVVMLASVVPPAMSSGMSPVIPGDMHGRLMDGAIGLGLGRIDERWDAAAAYEAKFQGMVVELGRRKNSRVGSRPGRMRVHGYDWR